MLYPTELRARQYTGAIYRSGGGIVKPFGSTARRTRLGQTRRVIGQPATRADGDHALFPFRGTVAGLSQRADSGGLAASEQPFEWGRG